MPPGVPVATVSIGKPGAKNAGLLAAQILAISNSKLSKDLADYKNEMAVKVEQQSKKLTEY